MNIISKVKEYIKSKALLENKARVIIGLSGGADSVALLDILVALGYDCIAAHCNFHLREEESDRDFIFVKEMCSKNNIEFVYTDFDTKKYMEDKSISLEMAARELRYNWFEQIKIDLCADKIAIAHHQDDSVETVLINLIRGTGIRGLSGISVINENIIRPLLCTNRAEIIDYLNFKQISFVEDSTNSQDIYNRNKIRLNVIPLLETINPSVKQSISRTSEHLLSVEKIYRNAVKKIVETTFTNNRINIGILKQQIEPETILFEILNPCGFNSASIADIYNSLEHQSGKRFYSEKYLLIKDRDFLILDRIETKDSNIYTITESEQSIKKPIRLKIENLTFDDNILKIDKNKNTIFLDKNKLKYPLTIRRWTVGDKFIPFGMAGSKKISDYFSDRKFTLIDKENIWLLCSGDKIIWIIGERADNRFRITSNTTDILKITLD